MLQLCGGGFALPSKTIALGVTGSIASYKAAELTRLLVKRGYQVHVIMTEAATRFITPLTMQTLSRHRVHMDMFETGNWEIEHISLASRADLFLVAPATANLIAKLKAGLADNLLTSTILATSAPVLIAPAMNTGMYENPIMQESMRFLKSHGYFFVEPDIGSLACGTRGRGRLAELNKIAAAVDEILSPVRDFSGRRVMVTAGPTQEQLDPVRYLTNRSSGKMGYALAVEAERRGASVTLISGPTQLDPPAGVELITVSTAQEMYEAVSERYNDVDLVIKAAAVADFRPREQSSQKIKKGDNSLTLELERTPDILRWLGEHKNGQILVGFAAETENMIVNAREKLRQKNLDLLVANDLTAEGAGFAVDTNVVTILHPDGSGESLPKLSKSELARLILNEVQNIFAAQGV
jgi:phosphopantothenoylcysteine decarboxylase/phosphopantothenate--cysteine ligase